MVASTRFLALASLGALCVAASARPAQADSNDLVLSRLGTVSGNSVVGSNINFRALASELGVVMAPRLSEPADTLGFGGFHFTADTAFTSISSNAAYWRALETPSDGTMTTTGLFVRKGMWIPLPSFEMGIGAVHLGASHMWASQGYVKFALQEGYHDLPLPSLAVRGAASRIMGSEQIDLTVASLDVVVSKDFGIAGMFRASPYVAWNWLFIVPRSEVIDKTPNIDSRADPADANMNFAFSDQDDIIRQRILFGSKFKYYIFTLTLEASFALKGTSVDDKAGTSMRCRDVDPSAPTSDCDATDIAGAQTTFTTSLGLDF